MNQSQLQPQIERRAYACLPREVFRCGDYRVRAVQDGHIEAIRQWRNAQMDVLRQGTPIEPAEQQAYFARAIWPGMAEARPETILFSLFHGDACIGYGGLVHIAWAHRRAELSFLLEPARARDEACYRADFPAFIHLMKEVAFAALGLNRLWTETYAIRPLHIGLLEANGLVREGVMRQHIWLDGRPVDALIHGCLRDEHEA